MEEKKLSIGVKAGYGICDLGGNLFFTAIAFAFFFYLTDTVLIAPALAGIVVAAGKIWDAVTDPVVGFISDRTNTRWGRRRPFILFGSFPLFLTMIIMFVNPLLFFDSTTFFNPDVFSESFAWTEVLWNPKEHQTFLLIWGIVCFCLLNLAYTLVNIPYSSLTPELTQDYHERTSLNGYRFGCAVFGTLLGAAAVFPIIQAFPNQNIGFLVLGVIFGAVMMITALITFFAIREPMAHGEKPTKSFFETYLKVFKNKPYLLILFTYALHITALTVITSVAVYYFKYIHQAEEEITTAMLILLVTAMVFIPISVLVSKKYGKKVVYGIGMAVFSLSVLILSIFGHNQPINFSFIMMFFAGVGLGFTYVMPYAIVPDTIEYDYLLTGERTEGSFYGIWTFMLKIGQALALAITGVVLQLTGYVENVIPQPEPMAEFGILLLLGAIPAVIFFFAIVMLYHYPINEERYKEIIEKIRTMEKKRA
jgi:GPH family glycoside/pentoside/hexuronide:cation symporter